jgi:hypothetical protein
MTLDAWLAHYRAQPGYIIQRQRQRQGKTEYYVVYDEDGVICDWRPVE